MLEEQHIFPVIRKQRGELKVMQTFLPTSTTEGERLWTMGWP
jgi:hypothetical protein